MDIVLLAVFSLIIVGIRKQDKSALPTEKLSKENLVPIRGIICLFIIFHHFSHVTSGEHDIAFQYFRFFGYVFASVFFAISGYALSVQYELKKDSYLNNFLKKRLKELLLPYLIVTIMYIVLYSAYDIYIHRNVFQDISFRLYDTIINGNTLVRYSWYVEVAVFMYILFYVAKRIFHNRKRDYSNIIILIGVVLFIIFCRCIGYGDWWYFSAMSFPFGAMYFNFTKSSVYKKIHPLCIALIAFLLFAVSYTPMCISIFTGNLSVIDASFRSCLFPLIIFSALQIVKIKSNILRYIGTRSYEIYLVQGIPIKVLKPLILKIMPYGFLSELIFLIISLICCVALGEIVYQLNNKLKKIKFTTNKSNV